MALFAALGPIKFETNNLSINGSKGGTPKKFKASTKANLSPLSRMGMPDAVQHNGRQARSIVLEYEFNALISGPRIEELAIQLDQYLEDGTNLSLIQGTGRRWGVYLIEGHEYEVLKSSQGLIKQVSGVLTLKESVR